MGKCTKPYQTIPYSIDNCNKNVYLKKLDYTKFGFVLLSKNPVIREVCRSELW